MATTFAGSKYHDNEGEDEEEDEEDSAESGSTSSFSLQECINEFRARRIRRFSTHSRDREMTTATEEQAAITSLAADAYLINQNRCNKAQERKGKPCKNGFCYCFTSDSGDCGSTAPPRDWHVRHQKRSRRPESTKIGIAQSTHKNLNIQLNQRKGQIRRQNFRFESDSKKQAAICSQTSVAASPLTAINSLRAVGDDAPLIHIIQELRDNCVISEVRVNKEKLPSSRGLPISAAPEEKAESRMQKTERIEYRPTAPPLSNISEQETLGECDMFQTEATSLPGVSLSSSRRKVRRSFSGGGRLLQKRLSHCGQVNFKPHDVDQPPPKPPRRTTQSLDGKTSLSSMTSTSPSVRDAEQVLDEFLRKHGVQLPNSKTSNKRKSYPLANKEKPIRDSQLPTCPSLSDMERVVESKRGVHYDKNIRMASKKNIVSDKPMKDIMMGWTEPKINDMLNYDSLKLSLFKTLASEAEPQVAPIGWQIPVIPKISLDTVDGVSDNLAVNMDKKHTPIKYSRLPKSKQSTQKFIWGEQLRNLSPWNGNGNKKRTGFRIKSKKFLNSSKNKILRFVSPKKSNQQDKLPTPRLCTVGVQTSASRLHLNLQSQSPPGSYHSPVQTTPSATNISIRQHQYHQNNDCLDNPRFDFDRKVKPPTPPKKVLRVQRPRKLNFQGENTPAPTTYRSYHKDLDQDVTITKMGYLLSSIRAKLEATDEQASRTFRECTRFTPLEQRGHPNPSFDCIDGPRTGIKLQDMNREPIYSEIEEDCMHFSGSPQYDVRTAVQHEPDPISAKTPSVIPVSTPVSTLGSTTVPTSKISTSASTTVVISETTPQPSPLPFDVSAVADFSALYAKVQKTNKSSPKPVKTKEAPVQPRPLGQFLQESLVNGSFFQFMPLPDEPPSDTSYTVSTTRSITRISEHPTLSMHQSLNNINEQHSPPKKNKYIFKSELSLQRSEIFLENLYRNEIVQDPDDNVRLEKVENICLIANQFAAKDDDTVSYDIPNELYNDYVIKDADKYGSIQLEPPPPLSDNQSTPKKQNQRFTTKPTLVLNINNNDALVGPGRIHNASLSCPTTPQQPANPCDFSNLSNVKTVDSSLGELEQSLPSESNQLSISTLSRYRMLKDAVHRSYRKGKNFLLAEKQRLTHSLSMSRDQSNQTEVELDSSTYYSSFNMDSLLNDSLTTREQLAQAVSLCRKMPELEISSEMVEAERLLLFTTLQKKEEPLVTSETTSLVKRETHSILIDALHLPVKNDVHQDMFFNYYYICTVESEGRIRSTQSIECQNGAAVFRDCGLEFYSEGQAESLEVRCQIFMLRLRKVSTLSLEPPKTLLKRGSGSVVSGSSSNLSHKEQIVSRFRLHASFTLKACDLVPYELVSGGNPTSDRIWLHAARTWQLPLLSHTKSSNLMPQIALSGRIELRLPKSQHAGFLNVQDPEPNNKHNWNRRWCILDGLCLSVWHHEHNLTNEPPWLQFQLETCTETQLNVAPRELCARARSFLLQGSKTATFFAADTQAELIEWLLHLNEMLTLARRWLNAPSI